MSSYKEEQETKLKKWVHDIQSTKHEKCPNCNHKFKDESDFVTPGSVTTLLDDHETENPKDSLSKIENVAKMAKRVLATVTQKEWDDGTAPEHAKALFKMQDALRSAAEIEGLDECPNCKKKGKK